MHKSKFKQLRLAVLLAWIPLSVNAAGLGKLTVNSGLGEPLNAEIELVSTTPEEMSSLSARIAPEEAYSAQGIERIGIHSAIRVEVSKRAGTPVLKLSSSQPVTDPFLDMLIQVDWATGRLVREYTVLLDPPGYSAEQTNNISVPDNTQSATSAPSQSAPEKIKTEPVARQSQKSAQVETDESYKTKRGDSLAKIAREMQVQDVSLDQMLVGLYRANKDAFDNDNMNQLKVGKIIKVPTQAELLATPKQEASEEVRVQAADWNNYRNKLAGIVQDSVKTNKSTTSDSASAKEVPANVDASASKGKITAPAVDKAMPADTSPRDVVKLSKSEGDKKKAEAEGAQAMKDKLNALQEESLAREKSIKDANEKANLLDKQVADLQKLLTMKDKSLAEMQKNAEALKSQQKTEPVKPAEPAPVAEKAPEPVTTTPVAEPKPAEVPTPPAAEPAKPVEVAKPAEPAQTAPAPVPAPAPPAVEASFVDDLDPVLLGGGLGAIALLGGAWAWLRNKRKRNLDNFEKGILTAGGLKANTVFGNTSGGTVDTGDTSFLTDFSQSVNGMIDTHDVDPIAEAEVYMAYGREAQAEEILNDAITKDPTRYELHLKLLEIYGGRNDSSAFEAISGELYSTLGVTHPVWAKVAELGRKMEPDNPLYDVPETTIEPQALESAITNTANTLEDDASDADEILDIGDFGGAKASADNGLDFSLSGEEEPTDKSDPLNMFSESEVEEISVANTDDDSLDFDLETEPQSEPAVFDLSSSDSENTSELADNIEIADTSLDLSTSTVEEVQEDSDMAMDFNFGDADAEPAVEAPATTVAESFDLSMPELELPDLSAQVDEPAVVETLMTDDALSFDEPVASPEDTATPLENVSEILDSVGELDFSFDLDAQAETVPELDITEPVDVVDMSLDIPEEVASTAAAPDIDLSAISLDLDESANVEEISMSVGEESEDVNTKLDLVTAYIDMGDSEGARELLEEVIKEGGATQRERAEKMLASLL